MRLRLVLAICLVGFVGTAYGTQIIPYVECPTGPPQIHTPGYTQLAGWYAIDLGRLIVDAQIIQNAWTGWTVNVNYLPGIWNVDYYAAHEVDYGSPPPDVICQHGATITGDYTPLNGPQQWDWLDVERYGFNFDLYNTVDGPPPNSTSCFTGNFAGVEFQEHLEAMPWKGGELIDTLVFTLDSPGMITIYDGLAWGYKGECVPEPISMVMLGCLGVGMAVARKFGIRK